ncbi:addiction module protein [Thiorhodococcus mannitoliphagus]|uniref:Addiction module protein n=1 Tax=Thiorhodococcus mannitoliphagus TaxID=329406 RepID=A0A6P1DS90_9GAMM|nr:addiction module protein [Thiorhodococcus mannitoliphagus]NEX20420.1 addiction module protein [Thiorhodococcus mannitoliphagus]
MKPNLQLDQMTVEEKIQTMELLWDSLSQAPVDLETPDWHREILEERQRKVDAGEAVFLSLEELKARRPR